MKYIGDDPVRVATYDKDYENNTNKLEAEKVILEKQLEEGINNIITLYIFKY
jgi:hypothetical protein